ncbi:MAG: hypothetical protein IID44_00130 [Planctomycetes bacterium]|nr:hypothetical protein [Planctomycetota bacterium]
MNASPHKRRWYQFSLKTLMIVMTVATVAFGGWVQYRQYRALQKQKEETAAWLQKRFGEHNGFFGPNPYHDRCILFFPHDLETPKQDSPQCEILP